MAESAPEDAPQSDEDFVAAWLQEIDAASDEEKDWREDATKAWDAYKGARESNVRRFNIYHSNVETIVPALYNSTPVPDVRRRFEDEDPVGKQVADMLERALSYSIDSYDFDDQIKPAVKDMEVVDRGIMRVRYTPYFAKDETVGYEEVTCEHVAWGTFRHGPASKWSDVAWISFEHFLSQTEVTRLAGKEAAKEIPFTYSGAAQGQKRTVRENQDRTPRFGKRARVLEIWDKDERKVHFICPDYGKRKLATIDDPLKLDGFFPIPRPMQPVSVTDSLVPITSLSLFADLIDELNEVSRRIAKLVKQLRPRGGYADTSGGASASSIKAITEADDGELVPLQGLEMVPAAGGSLDKMLTWFPLEPTVLALKQLIEHREIIKNAIFEVTGIADIMRGMVNPEEKLGQSQMKAQFGSVRIQSKQAEVARFVRDLLRMKAEIICNRFSMQTLSLMTGLTFPSQQEKQAAQAMLQRGQQMVQQAQASGQPIQLTPEMEQMRQQLEATVAMPSAEDVEALLRNDAIRAYRIDIESDSTIRGDLMRNQQMMSTFLQGTAQFATAIGPAVQEGVMPPDTAVEIYAAFARQFKLGKQAEDALERLAEKTRSAAQNGQPQQQPDPEMLKTQAQLQIVGAKAEADKAKAEQKMQHDERMAEIKESEAVLGLQVKEREAEIDMARNDAKLHADMVRASMPKPQTGQGTVQ